MCYYNCVKKIKEIHQNEKRQNQLMVSVCSKGLLEVILGQSFDQYQTLYKIDVEILRVIWDEI